MKCSQGELRILIKLTSFSIRLIVMRMGVSWVECSSKD